MTVTAESLAPASLGMTAERPDGTLLPMTQGATDASGFTTWTGAFTIDPAAPDGPVSARLCVPKPGFSGACSTLQPWELASLVAAPSVRIDTTPPDTAAGRIYPLSGGNVVTTGIQPLRIKVTDAGGISPSGVVFTLTDTTTGTVTTRSATAQVADWFETSGIVFTPGHLYRVSATVTDIAGNSVAVAQAPTEQGGGFLGVTVSSLTGTNPATSARSSAVAAPQSCAVGDINTGTLTRTVTCTNVVVDFPDVPLTFSGTRHGGTAYLNQSVSLANLKIHPTVAGSSAGQNDITPLPTGTLAARQRFTVPGPSNTPVTVRTADGQAVIPVVTATVGITVDGATIDMVPTLGNNATTMACTTAPIAAWCSPDPLPPVVDEGGQPVTDVVALPGGVVFATLNGGAQAFFGPAGTVVRRTVTQQEVPTAPGEEPITDGTVVQAAQPPEPLNWALDEAASWRDTAGWLEGSLGAIGTRWLAGQSPTQIARAAEAYQLEQRTATPPVERRWDTVPVGDVYSDGCMYEKGNTDWMRGQACWSRTKGSHTQTDRYLGDKSWAYMNFKSPIHGKSIQTEHEYEFGDIVDFQPKSDIPGDCSNVTLGIQGWGLNMSVSGNVCEEKIHPDLWSNGTGSIGPRGFKTKWSDGDGAVGAQATIQENVIHVPDNSKPSGFRYSYSKDFRIYASPFPY